VSPHPVAVSSTSGLIAALKAAKPGDVITIADGIYSGCFVLNVAGTADNPIVIRGASETGTILDGGGQKCNAIETYGAGFVHIERMTIQNVERAIRFQTSGSQANVVQHVQIRKTRLGIGGNPGQLDFYICDNTLQGLLSWPLVYRDDGGLHSSDDGIAVQGAGHVVCYNRISGYGDAMKTAGNGARAIDFYGNEILYSYDNAIELDGSAGNVRCLRNRFTNTFDAISTQPVHAGPAYIIGNVVVNAADEQLKFHGLGTVPPQDPNGMLVYHNTFVSPFTPLNLQTTATSHHFELLNNLFVGPPVTRYGATVLWTGPIDDGRFDYNGYFPDGTFGFMFSTNGSKQYKQFYGFKNVQAGGIETHGLLLSGQIFLNGLTAPANYTTLVSPQSVALAPSSNAIDRGVVLPNVNDGYTGAAPDLGAVESGVPVTYGPRPESATATSSTDQPSSTPVFRPIRINSGGSSYTDARGLVWSADTGYTGGSVYRTTATILNTAQPALYQSERYGSTTYQFAVPNGTYVVTLKFAEICFTQRGERVFDVLINNTKVLSNFDIVAQTGGRFIPIDRQFSVNVSNGRITVQTSHVVQYPKISAIEIVAK
jgi:hypothetical protein